MQLRSTCPLAIALGLAFIAGTSLDSVPPALAQDGAGKGKAPKASPAGAPMLVALGGSVAFECYSSCGYLGALADGLESNTYTPGYVRVRVLGLAGGLRVSLKQLKALDRAPMSATDRRQMGGLQKSIEGMISQCRALSAYCQTRAPEQAKAFRTARRSTWDQLAVTLGLGKLKATLAPGGAKLGLK